jgi:hypothetical protein
VSGDEAQEAGVILVKVPSQRRTWGVPESEDDIGEVVDSSNQQVVEGDAGVGAG